MVRISNVTAADYLIHFELTPIDRFPEGGKFGVQKERQFDDTDWFWFNMTAASGTGRSDRVIFNLSETSDDPLAPVNMNLWLFAYRSYFRPAGGSTELDILNSSFQNDAPYNLSQNPEPRYEEVAATASYTGIYFLEVETFNNSGIYDVIKRFDTGTPPANDLNNQPSQAQGISWGEYWGFSLDQADDHTDFYRVTARAGDTIDVYYQMPNRDAPDGRFTKQPAGLVWVGIYQPGMQLLNWAWNYHYDYLNSTDSLANDTRVKATVAADGDYIVEISALQDGYIGAFQLTPMRTIQVFWHMDWDFKTEYRVDISLLPEFNAFPEEPVVTAPIPDLIIDEDENALSVIDLADFFYDADIMQGDVLRYEFPFSGASNVTIQESGGIVSVIPDANWHGTNTLRVVAKDRLNTSAGQYWNITARSVNDAPQLVSAGPINISEDAGVRTYELEDYVRDVDGDTLTFTQLADANVTLTFTQTSLRLQTANDFETTRLGAAYPVTFDVGDGQVTTRMTILINVGNILDAPERLQATFTVACDEDMLCPTIDLRTVFYDPDGDQLSYTVGGNNEVPFDFPNNNTLRLLPPRDWNGVKTIQLQAYKVAGNPLTQWRSEFAEVNFVVRPVNDPPRVLSVSPIPNVTMEEFQSKGFSIVAEDPEHVTPKFSWYLNGEPLGTTLSSFTYIPTYDTAHGGGSAVLVLRVEIDDGSGGRGVHEWTVTVVDVPRGPQIQIAAPLEGTGRGYYVGDEVRFIASAYDPDGDTLTYTWTDSGGATLLTGDQGNVKFDVKGTRKVILTVTDGILTATTTVNVTIEDKPAEAPGIGAPYIVSGLAIAAVVAAVAQRRRRGA
jgi:hypothetical protein